MKHFWVFAFVSIILTLFFSGFAFPEKGYAQPIDSQTTTGNILNATVANYDYFYNKGLAVFSATEASFASLKEAQTALVDSPAKQKRLGQIDENINLINQTKQAYLAAFETNKTKSLSATATQIAAVVAGRAKFNEISNSLTIGAKQEPFSQALIKTFVEQFDGNSGLLTEAKKIENGTIQPGSEISSTYGNATPISTAGQTVVSVTNSTNACTSLANSSFLGCITEGFIWFVKSIVLNIVGFFLWMSANLLNFAMYHGVFEFKKFAPNDIYNIWLVVRQIISLFVFFTGLFVGFMAIIGKSEEFKKYIAFLVVFGLFVNFSYPIVRVFVDVSNVVSLQIYQTALGKEVLADNPSSDSTAGARIMASLGLQGLVASATSLPTAGNKNGFIDQVTSLPGALAVVGFVGYAAYIFFMAAFLIIIRTALLVCIIIASPILLVDTIVPALGEKAKWLRGMFVSQLFVAPVFTIMLALTLKFLDIFSAGNTGPSALSSAGTTGTSSVTVFFNLIMMLVMLHIMLKVTKAVAGGVGETVTNWAGKAGGLGTGLALGAGGAAVGFGLRNTAGRFAKNLGEKDWGGGVMGNMAKDTFQGMGKRSYDLRNLGATGAIAGTLGITGMGQGSKESYAGNREEYEKKAYERAGEIQDDGERDKYLNRKFSTGNFAKLTGGVNENAKAYKNFVKGDEDIMKQYVNASDKDKEKIREDEKNKKYLQRFGNIDKTITNPGNVDAKSKLSIETQKAVEDKEKKMIAEKARNDSRIAGYLTADQSTRENILANAIKAGDDKLIKQLQVMDNLRGKDFKTINSTDLAGLNDSKLADKVLTQTKAYVETQDAIKEARLSSSPQVLKDSADQMTTAINNMMSKNNDLANLLRDLVQNNTTTNSTPTQATPGTTVGTQTPQSTATV